MSLIKKVDVANYFSSRKRKGIHAQRTVSQADATGYSGNNPVGWDLMRATQLRRRWIRKSLKARKRRP